ncbi:hypothetical protein GO013_12010 [Pseudodesulfovibrio sp. JC047]|uniref:cytochrome P460 family protein n=1 Tax=Pseudodesulfovibrio sp. JC047 TaxID=2683199 RepID=UPI0013D39920|nr:cytochrome P460 family protein [Pseudodesulfovibrio sp. JC047]NDV20139.1 hypothetical protein [Pseudodesulfovibrio sp. JC047]
MKKCCVIALFLTCALTLLAGTVMAEDMPGPDSAKLWEYITTVDPYTEWGFWPDHEGMQDGRAPHGPKHKVFVNATGLKCMMAPVMPGTIEVKENYSEDEKELLVITVMYKIKGYNPDAGDWYWVKYMPDGTVKKAGKPAGCIGCHATRVANDYILVHEFK